MMRYSRNMNMISDDENSKLKTFTVAIIGCGGLGGYVIEMLARLGIGHLICIDGDTFDQSNWNRQLLSNEQNLNQSKAETAVKHIGEINSEIKVSSYNMYLDESNAEILKECDVIVDAVDSIDTKLMIETLAELYNKPLVYGAIAGWYGQLCTILPGDQILKSVYRSKKSIEKNLGNPSFTPATVASMQVAEVLKLLLNKGELLRHKMLFIDLLTHDYEIIEFNQKASI